MRVIDEHQLAAFRDRELAPAVLYGEIGGNDAVVLVPLPPGVGKSRAAQALVPYALQQGHDLVVYVSPTRGIIDEMQISDRLSPETVVILTPRPRHLCGAADAEWTTLERNGCAALAKSLLCEPCVHNEHNGGECGWPDQMQRIGPDTCLVVLTEQYLLLNPLLLPQIHKRAKARRMLVVLDEALFLTSAVSRRFTRAELLHFRAALAETAETEPVIKSWLEGIDFLLDPEVELTGLSPFWPGSLSRSSVAVQATGHHAFGPDFRYLAPELELLNSAVASSQWRDGDVVEIAMRVETSGLDVIVLAAYLDNEIVEERLGRPVNWLLRGIVFRHSETRIINIADPIGTARTMSAPCHFDRVVDFFLALAMRNATQGRRTAFVARKQFLDRIKSRVEAVSTMLGRPLACVLASPGDSFDECRPTDIPLINYGVVGVNSLEAFDALYCIGGYYARADHLNAVYQQTLPPNSRMPIGIRMEGRRRQLYAADHQFDTRFHARRAAATHQMLERRVVLQAIGRVRPFTSPAEIIVFQCDDLSAELGEIEEFGSLAAARRCLGVPTLCQLKRAALGETIRARQQDGESLRAIAADLGISPSTGSLAAHAVPFNELLDGMRSCR
jgi:hypothetical protein